MLFAAKYGKEFVQAASELMPDCGVNRQVRQTVKHHYIYFARSLPNASNIMQTNADLAGY